eukprot:5636670-Amphidinium_carterae.1
MRRQMAENVRQLEASAADGARKAVGQAMASLPQDGGSAAAAASAPSLQTSQRPLHQSDENDVD